MDKLLVTIKYLQLSQFTNYKEIDRNDPLESNSDSNCDLLTFVELIKLHRSLATHLSNNQTCGMDQNYFLYINQNSSRCKFPVVRRLES